MAGLEPGSGCVPAAGGRSRQWLEESLVGEAAGQKPPPEECRFSRGLEQSRVEGGDCEPLPLHRPLVRWRLYIGLPGWEAAPRLSRLARVGGGGTR